MVAFNVDIPSVCDTVQLEETLFFLGSLLLNPIAHAPSPRKASSHCDPQ